MPVNAVSGLAAVARPNATVLILGSMPGVVSLTQQQYYAHPRNAFWPIMADLAGFSTALAYNDKLDAVTRRGVALWDVIAHCQRSGSLDSAIRHEQLNDFQRFFARQPALRVIGFNGSKAWQSFKRHLLPTHIVPAGVRLVTLPSTSPAHASVSFADKREQWSQLGEYLISIK